MNNAKVLQLLEKQRDDLYTKLKSTTISQLYREQYEDLKSGRVFVFDNGERQMLKILKKLAGDTSMDEAFKSKLDEYIDLDNTGLIRYFEEEITRVVNEICDHGRQDEIQALFIEYDYYYHFTSCVSCYGQQEYPLIEEPRYLSNEFDSDKQVLFIDNGVNFRPAWVECLASDDLDYLEVGYELEKLFQLHSRTVLFKSLENLDKSGFLDKLKCRPFTFYINEHDCEVMMLYRFT